MTTETRTTRSKDGTVITRESWAQTIRWESASCKKGDHKGYYACSDEDQEVEETEHENCEECKAMLATATEKVTR
jgi:hypothetical protein